MKVIGHFAGKSVLPVNYYQNVRVHTQPLATNSNYVGRVSGSSSTFSLLASGARALIIIDDENHFYNVAYNDPIVQSGRSFAASGSRKLLDATHRDYLKAVDAAIAPSKEATMEFYQVLLETLTSTDTSGVQELSKEGQIAFSDFLSVYSADLDHHEKVGFPLQFMRGNEGNLYDGPDAILFTLRRRYKTENAIGLLFGCVDSANPIIHLSKLFLAC